MMKAEEVYNKAIETHGREHLYKVAIAEMSELQKELRKNFGGTDNRTKILEQIADVLIMLQQLLIVFGCEDALCDFYSAKLKCLERRRNGQSEE